MGIIAKLVIAIVAILHLYFLWLEMFAWTSYAPKIFRHLPKENFEKTKSMASHQGLYNGFLAAGLIWTFFIADPYWSRNIAFFFLGCVVIAGLYGGYDVNKKIFFIQGIPALIGLILLFLAS
jgi:putative membrane protein